MQLRVEVGGLDAAQTDVLAMVLFEEGAAADLVSAEVDARLEGALAAALEKGQVSGTLHTVTSLLALGRLPGSQLLIVGGGKQAEWTPGRARTVAGTAVRQLRTSKQPNATLLLPAQGDLRASVAAAAHGAVLADFFPGAYKSGDPAERAVDRVTILVPSGDQGELSRVSEKGLAIGEGGNLARGIANEPGNKLTPTSFAERARRMAEEHGLECAVMDEAEMEERGYGALLGVSRGSAEPAKLVTLRYRGGGSGPVVGLVGKGITFDSGGISIKPAENMHLMKTDMSGAAAVLGAMHAVSHLKPRAEVVAVLCLSENLPGPSAMKPGDILTAGNGKTIEVLNTDAEGRLVLADGLVHARSQGATHLVDVATLTGACVVALGKVATGVFGSSPAWTKMLLEAAAHTGEKMWELPTFPEYREQLDSEIADIANVGGREGGAITAALFLKEFAEDAPWVHLDVAGTAYSSTVRPYISRGPTGAAVATLTQLVESVAAKGVPA